MKARIKLLIIGLIMLNGVAATANKTPSEAYLEFHSVLKNSFSDQAIWPYYTKAARDDFEQRFPPAMRGRAFYIMKSSAPSEVAVQQEVIEGSKATLILLPTSTSHVDQGEAIMRLENGNWKLEKVTWRVP